MNIKTVSNAITRVGARRLLTMKKHSPGVLFVVGVVGVVATTILASKATMKLEEVVEEHEMRIDDVKTNGEEDYSERDRQRDLAIAYARMTVGIARLYAPAIAVGVVSVTALTGSHVILTRRNMALTAAYAALDRGFREYRGRVSAELGVEKEQEFRYGAEKHTVVDETPEGPVTTTIVRPLAEGASIYARFFDENSSSWSRNYEYNRMFVRCQQTYANDLLRARGHVMLNEVYDMLGLPRTKEGCVVGWVLGKGGDDYIDFGVFSGDTYSAMRFVNGDERSILLDFNVDGVVYDKI